MSRKRDNDRELWELSKLMADTIGSVESKQNDTLFMQVALRNRSLAAGLEPSQFKQRKKFETAKEMLDAQDKELKIAKKLLQDKLQRSDKISKWWEKRFKELEKAGGSGTT